MQLALCTPSAVNSGPEVEKACVPGIRSCSVEERERVPDTAERTLWDPTQGVGFGGAIPARGVTQSGR